jgi:flagellar biosynthesis protein
MYNKHKDNSRQKAVAIKYDVNDISPKVMAKGSGFVAEKLLEKGSELGIPVYKDEKLVEELTKLNLGDNIPPELYQVVAQVLTFISDLDKLKEKLDGK